MRRIARGGLASLADLDDPANGAVTLADCLYDASAKTQPLLASAVLGGGRCNGKPCWKSLASGIATRTRARPPMG
jgi:hypothetical protein